MSEWANALAEIQRIYKELGPRAMLTHVLEQYPHTYQAETLDAYRRVCRMHFGSNPLMSGLLGLAVLRMKGMPGDNADQISEFVIELQEQVWSEEKKEAELQAKFPGAR